MRHQAGISEFALNHIKPHSFSLVLQIVSRTGKLAYEWRGLKHLPELLDRLVADQVQTDLDSMRALLCTAQDHCSVHG